MDAVWTDVLGARVVIAVKRANVTHITEITIINMFAKKCV